MRGAGSADARIDTPALLAVLASLRVPEASLVVELPPLLQHHRPVASPVSGPLLNGWSHGHRTVLDLPSHEIICLEVTWIAWKVYMCLFNEPRPATEHRDHGMGHDTALIHLLGEIEDLRDIGK